MSDEVELIARAIHAKMRNWRVAKTMTHYEFEEYEAEWLALGEAVLEAVNATRLSAQSGREEATGERTR